MSEGPIKIELELEQAEAQISALTKEVEDLKAKAYAAGIAAGQERERNNNLKALSDKLAGALNEIASWDEGETVSGKFDCPEHAKFARRILKEVGWEASK